jgi:hypothetical protein
MERNRLLEPVLRTNMKRIIVIAILILLCAFPVQAGIMTGVAGASGGVGAALCVDGTHDSAGNTILLCEDFPGTGTNKCDGTNNGGNGVWAGAGSPDCTRTALKSEGGKSVLIDSTSVASDIAKSFTASSTVYTAIIEKWPVFPSVNKSIFALRSLVTNREVVSVTSGGKIYLLHGTANNTSSAAMTADQVYIIWAKYVAASASPGCDGIGMACFTTDRTQPAILTESNCNNIASYANCACTAVGTSTQSPSELFVGSSGAALSNNKFHADRFRLKISPLGSNHP